TFALLFCTEITRYVRPNTLCSLGEKLTRPEAVGRLRNRSKTAASFAPSVEPVFLTAAATASTSAAPVIALPVGAGLWIAFIRLKSDRTCGFGSSPKIDAYATYQ